MDMMDLDSKHIAGKAWCKKREQQQLRPLVF
jgi:hypothetical protein